MARHATGHRLAAGLLAREALCEATVTDVLTGFRGCPHRACVDHKAKRRTALGLVAVAIAQQPRLPYWSVAESTAGRAV